MQSILRSQSQMVADCHPKDLRRCESLQSVVGDIKTAIQRWQTKRSCASGGDSASPASSSRHDSRSTHRHRQLSERATGARSECSALTLRSDAELLDHEPPEQCDSLCNGPLDPVIVSRHGHVLDQHMTISRAPKGARCAHRHAVRRLRNADRHNHQIVHRRIRRQSTTASKRGPGFASIPPMSTRPTSRAHQVSLVGGFA